MWQWFWYGNPKQTDPKGARAVVCFDVFDVEQARQHNDMNVLCIGADYTDFETAKYMIEAFFKKLNF